MQKTSGLAVRMLRNLSSGARFLPFVALVLMGIGLFPAKVWAQQVPNVTYAGPLVIRQGGTYTGNYRSTDSSVPVIKIETTAPVILENCILVGPGDIIDAKLNNTQLTIRNNKVYGQTPTLDNRRRGRFLEANYATSVTVENNYVEHTTGIAIYMWGGNGSATQTLRVLRNAFKNIDGRYRNGGGTYANFLGLNGVYTTGNIEVAWNEVINEPNNSLVEDNINFYNSGGTSSAPARIHDNYIYGAFPYPATGSTYTGSGITLDGGATAANQVVQYVQAYGNHLVGTCAAMNIASGNNNSFYNNRIITSGYLPDGSRLNAMYAGIAIWNAYGQSSSLFHSNSMYNNTSGFVSWGRNSPFTNRLDVNTGACATCTNTTFLPNPITLQTEQNEYVLWQQKLQQNGITIGVGGSTTTPQAPANQAPTVSLALASTSLTLGASVALTATAADADGTVTKVEFYSGATKLGEDTSAPYTFSLTPAAIGKLSLTAVATDNAGASTTSAAVVLNVAAAPVVTAPNSNSGTTVAGTLFRAININGSATSIDGKSWEASSGAANLSLSGIAFANQNVTLNPATDAARAQMIRSCIYSNKVSATISSVPNGSYNVYLYVWEDNYAQTFDITVQGTKVESSFNSGSAGSWQRLGPYAASVTNGSVSIITAGGHCNLSGIELWNAGTLTPTAPANQAPTVSLAAASSTITVGQSVALTATAADADGTVSKVAFYSGATKLGEDTSAPYTFSFSPATTGTYTLTAVATDNDGASTTSAAVSVAVNPVKQAPTVTLAAATNALTLGQNVVLTATAADADGTVTKVDFYNGSTKVGTATAAPYKYTLAPTTTGSYTLTAVATDNDGLSTTSAAVTVAVNPAPVAPTVSLALASTSLTLGASVALTATAADADGTVTKVEFYSGATKLGEDTSAPYTFSLTPSLIGVLSLTAVATDNDGLTATSTAVALTVLSAPIVVVPTLPTLPNSNTNTNTTTSDLFRAININGSATTIDGYAFEAGSSPANVYTNARYFANQNITLNPATDAARAQMIRSSAWNYNLQYNLLNVPTGSYDVSFYVWEDNYSEMLTVQLNGQVVVRNYASGSAGTWKKFGPFRVSVTDGTIKLLGNNAPLNLSGIEVLKVTTSGNTLRTALGEGNLGSAASGAEATATTTTTSLASASMLQVYPNPAVDELNVTLKVARTEQVTLAVFNSNGVEVKRLTMTAAAGAVAQKLNVSDLPTGNYILKVLSGSRKGQTERIRVVK